MVGGLGSDQWDGYWVLGPDFRIPGLTYEMGPGSRVPPLGSRVQPKRRVSGFGSPTKSPGLIKAGN